MRKAVRAMLIYLMSTQWVSVILELHVIDIPLEYIENFGLKSIYAKLNFRTINFLAHQLTGDITK